MRVCECGRNIHRRYNSTIYPKYCPSCQLQKAVKTQSKKPRKSNGTTKSEKSRAMATADTWFSRYIRIKHHLTVATDGTVLNKCIVTGTVKEARAMDNGHCFSRGYLTTRYEEDNCRPQNRSSNRFSGEADHYKFVDNLTAEIGEERFNRLDRLRREYGEDSTEFYRSQADKYRKLANSLIKDLGVKKWW